MPLTKSEKIKKSSTQKSQKKETATGKAASRKTQISQIVKKEKEKKPQVSPDQVAPLASERKKKDKVQGIFGESAKRKYYEAVGRRKTAIARVRLYVEGDKKITVNSREFEEYFPTDELRMLANGALRKAKLTDNFFVSIRVQGGGPHG